MRLLESSVTSLPEWVGRPDYARAEQPIGIVHFGIGAFHRAHQAAYTDAAMSGGDRGFAIAGVSLRSTSVREQLAPQDCLYTVSEQDPAATSVRLIAAVRAVHAGVRGGAGVLERLAQPDVSIVTFTVTEKGYHRTPSGELDLQAKDVAADLSGAPPATIYGFLHRGLAERRARGGGGLTLMSCDNLSENGNALEAALVTFVSHADPELARWIETECSFPSTMVDRIVPATPEDRLDRLERQIGVRDEAAIFTEPFSQWVIEDRFAGRRPRWEVAGAQLVADVRDYEAAKLRMLNGAHSALAYLGLERGHAFVHEAISDPEIRPIVRAIMLEEAATSLPPTVGTKGYGERLMQRFANAALRHRLSQIAMDGSQKLPPRWLSVLAHHQRRGRSCPALLRALGAWVRHVRGEGHAVEDPMATELKQLWDRQGKSGIVPALFGSAGLFAGHWVASDADRRLLDLEIA